jgi:hypothetical protein
LKKAQALFLRPAAGKRQCRQGQIKSSFISGSSSFGRARPCQGRGGRFEPGLPLKDPLAVSAEDFFLVALVVELVDTQDLKSCGQQWPYRFNSDPGHNFKAIQY